MSREVMTQALEALEYIYEGANNQGPHTGISWRCVSNKAKPAITALRQAFANEALDKMAENARELGLDYEPAQQQNPFGDDAERYARKLREEREAYKAIFTAPAPQPAQQEPVFTYDQVKAHIQAAMMSAAQRTWVGLTDEEKSDIWCVVTNRDFVTEDTHVYADAIEAKLKEKNNG